MQPSQWAESQNSICQIDKKTSIENPNNKNKYINPCITEYEKIWSQQEGRENPEKIQESSRIILRKPRRPNIGFRKLRMHLQNIIRKPRTKLSKIIFMLSSLKGNFIGHVEEYLDQWPIPISLCLSFEKLLHQNLLLHICFIMTIISSLSCFSSGWGEGAWSWWGLIWVVGFGCGLLMD